MQLSAVYQKTMWVMVYHIQPDSETVELITNKLFESKKKALKWFARKRRPEAYVQPEAVRVYGLHKLELHSDRMLGQGWELKPLVPPTLLDDEETFGSKPR